MKCEECRAEIVNYWGYLSDFYPDVFPPRDRSNDQILYGIQVGTDKFHYFCSEEHRNIWGAIDEANTANKSNRGDN